MMKSVGCTSKRLTSDTIVRRDREVYTSVCPRLSVFPEMFSTAAALKFSISIGGVTFAHFFKLTWLALGADHEARSRKVEQLMAL